MAIHFDALPKEKPEDMGGGLPREGFHKVKITKAETTISKAVNKYLKLFLKTADGPVVFDNIFDSDAPALQYKLGRLVIACKLPLTGELSLEDLSKVLMNKELVADIKHIENEYQGKVTTKAEVDIFSNDIFYPIEDYASLVADTVPTEELPNEPIEY